MSNDPMEAIHALANRVVAEVEPLGVEVVRFIVLPMSNGPDSIQISFAVRPEAVMSTQEIESATLDAEFMDILGDFTVEGDVETGEITISGGDAPVRDDEETETMELLEERKRKLIEEMRRSLEEGDE